MDMRTEKTETRELTTMKKKNMRKQECLALAEWFRGAVVQPSPKWSNLLTLIQILLPCPPIGL
jgi:hypothetical protein